MKPFIKTTFVLFFIGAITIMVMVCSKIEKHKAQIEAHTRTIQELTDELHTMEVMYLKCAGSVQIEQLGAHYVDGKIKFYKTK
jgi:hypothetical protein